MKADPSLAGAASFNSEGYRLINLGGDELANAVHTDRRGRIVAAGKSNRQGTCAFALVRVMPDGRFDRRFGTNGFVFTDISKQKDEARAIVVQADGKLLVMRRAYRNDEPHTALVRYDTDGSLASRFGNGGIVIAETDKNDEEA